MRLVETVYQSGVIATIEQFTYKEEELRLFVIYTSFDKDKQPLYVGSSKDFYNTHFLNSFRLLFFDEIKYVGFCFFRNEDDLKDARKYYIKVRQPIHNKHKYNKLKLYKDMDFHLGVDKDDLAVRNSEMMQRWQEWLGTDDRFDGIETNNDVLPLRQFADYTEDSQ